VRPSRLRDRPCAFEGCDEFVLRESQFCRHHLGVLHGAASARSYRCSPSCQREHARCPRCHCLTGGSHVRWLRDGLCYQPGAPSCWSQLHDGLDAARVVWLVTCVLCSRSSEWLIQPRAHLYCRQCGSRLLEIEQLRVTAGQTRRSSVR